MECEHPLCSAFSQVLLIMATGHFMQSDSFLDCVRMDIQKYTILNFGHRNSLHYFCSGFLVALTGSCALA